MVLFLLYLSWDIISGLFSNRKDILCIYSNFLIFNLLPSYFAHIFSLFLKKILNKIAYKLQYNLMIKKISISIFPFNFLTN